MVSQSELSLRPAVLQERAARRRDYRRDVLLGRLGVVFTLLAVAGFGYSFAAREQPSLVSWTGAETIVYLFVVGFLIYGGLVYQTCRLGYFHRLQAHRREARFELDELYADDASPAVAILVPSYKEDPKVVSQTLISAALQNYSNHRVVLLIDDPEPRDLDSEKALEETRALPERIESWLRGPASRYLSARRRFRSLAEPNLVVETHRLADYYQEAGDWFAACADLYPAADHTDQLFVDRVIRAQAEELVRVAAELRSSAARGRVSAPEIDVLYKRLYAVFHVSMTSFERKRYRNLSHAPNKAMNLNSYIALLGKRWRESRINGRLYLEPDFHDSVHSQGAASFLVPDADYVLTVDADSLLDPDYTVRLVHLLEQPENERVAVVQTPYSAVPHSNSLVERVAGATTDIQYIVHQGFALYEASFWVGANALLRRRALDDIVTYEEERGYRFPLFIQDRTVIEDTESSVDLIEYGWRLYNYPERLTYSATPPDFGALVVQRNRWANGGLIILPKLVRYLARPPYSFKKLKEGFFRLHYLTSIAGASIGFLLLLLYPFEDSLTNLFLPLTALPYFALYARDLVHAGYRLVDLPRVYALNLMLVPVNVGGVLKSLYQGATGKKIAFMRTPKVQGRTAAPPLYVLSVHLIFVYCLLGVVWELAAGRLLHAIFISVNAAFFLYAIHVFIGWRASWEDGTARLLARRRRRALSPAVSQA